MDDNEHCRNKLKSCFESAGATVYAMGYLEKAIVLLSGMKQENALPDLILMDLRLPQCFGLLALREVYAYVQDSGCPIIVMSHDFNSIARSKMVFYGAVAYVDKPVKAERLFNYAAEIYIESLRRAAPPQSSETPVLKVA